MLYAVTDKRLILVREAVRDMDFGRIKSASLRRDADGHTSLLCGERALKAKPDKWRAPLCRPRAAETGKMSFVKTLLSTPCRKALSWMRFFPGICP